MDNKCRCCWFARSSNGRTDGSEPSNLGSNPSWAAKQKKTDSFYLFLFDYPVLILRTDGSFTLSVNELCECF